MFNCSPQVGGAVGLGLANATERATERVTPRVRIDVVAPVGLWWVCNLGRAAGLPWMWIAMGVFVFADALLGVGCKGKPKEPPLQGAVLRHPSCQNHIASSFFGHAQRVWPKRALLLQNGHFRAGRWKLEKAKLDPPDPNPKLAHEQRFNSGYMLWSASLDIASTKLICKTKPKSQVSFLHTTHQTSSCVIVFHPPVRFHVVCAYRKSTIRSAHSLRLPVLGQVLMSRVGP